jgi:hypothetical protein
MQENLLVQDESASRPMKPDELKILAERMFGRRWKSALAKAVGRDRVTIARYMKLWYPIPTEVADKVREMSRLDAAGKIIFDAIYRHCWRSRVPEVHQAAKNAEAGLYAAHLIKKE